MRYVQSLPPPVEPVPDSGTVRAIAPAHATPRVRERSLPPLVYRPQAAPPQLPAINRRARPLAEPGSDRRTRCRRLRNEPVLLELRSGINRRRRNQRRSDLTTVIDEQA